MKGDTAQAIPALEKARLLARFWLAIAALGVALPDLVFTDVEMPNLDGLEMLRRLEKPNFEVIFITSFDKYAVRALRLSTLDYLLKPEQRLGLSNGDVVDVSRRRWAEVQRAMG